MWKRIKTLWALSELDFDFKPIKEGKGTYLTTLPKKPEESKMAEMIDFRTPEEILRDNLKIK